MTLIEEAKCTIKYINDNGLGVSSTELGEVELAYSLPGEIVRFERHQYRRTKNCLLKEIEVKSEMRASPPCKYFRACGGCLLQHLNIDLYNDFKFNLVTSHLHKNNIDTVVNPVITVPFGNRRRANLEGIKKHDQLFLGFHRFHSNQIINIDNCMALSPELSTILPSLKNILELVLDNKQKIQIFITKTDNGIDCSFTIQEHKSLNETQREILYKFAKANNIIRLAFRHRKNIDIIYEIEKPFVKFGDIEVEIDAYCFLQASSMSDKILSDLIIEFFYTMNELSEIQVVDLFCGRGTYSLPLSSSYKVHGFESDKLSIDALRKANNDINLYVRDLFLHPLTNSELINYDYAVINPPRAGAEAQSVYLAISNIKKICYISCNPKTFARDAAILTANNYKLTSVTPVDQFYYSPHMELVGFFEKI
jgi:23S rRNA (uracil1939-C5)-methyltransferase